VYDGALQGTGSTGACCAQALCAASSAALGHRNMAGRGRSVQRLVQQHAAARAFSAVRTPQFASAVEASGLQGAAASANSSSAVRYARYARQCARLLGATLAVLTGGALRVLTEAVVDAWAGVCSCWPGSRAHADCLHALGGSRGPGAPRAASRRTRSMSLQFHWRRNPHGV